MKSGSNMQVNKDGKMTITAKDWATHIDKNEGHGPFADLSGLSEELQNRWIKIYDENYNSRLEELRLQKCKGYYKLEPNEEWYETGHGCVARDKRKEKSK